MEDGTLSVFRTDDLAEICRWPPGTLIPNEPAKPNLIAWHPNEDALAVSFSDHVEVALAHLDGVTR